jgi:replicative DNA helicase
MSEKYTLEGYLGDDFQLKCLWQLITEPEFAEVTIPLLETSYFDDPTYKRFFSVIRQYTESFGMPPNLQNRSILAAIRKFNKKTDVTEIEMLDAVAIQIKNWNDRVMNKELPHDGLVVQKETLNFIKQQEYRKVASYIITGVKEGNNSDEFLYDVEEKVRKISEIGDDDDMGIEIMENVTRALQPEFRKAIPTGIKGIDTLTKGGLGGGEIGIILAPSGVGKSTILSYIANTAYNHGLNVLQLIFEDTEDQIRRKHYAKWSKIPLSEMDDRRDEVHQRIVDWHKNNTFGRLIIKKFSQEDTTMPKVRQYIDKYRKKNGIKFDIVILDYIDVLESHKRSVDQNASELAIIKSFEAMASDLNIPCWTAIQTNRSGFNAELVDTAQMGGNIKRAQKTHFLMSIAKTAQQKLDHQANIAILKARMAQDGHVFKDCIFNNDTMEIRITDDVLPASTRSILKNKEITDEDRINFSKKVSAINENQETEQYIKPDDTIDVNAEIIDSTPSEVINKIHNNSDFTVSEKDDIAKKLELMRKKPSELMEDKK